MLENIKSKNKVKGNLGENIVNEYIEKNGYKLICKNFKSYYGEIDIIFKDKDEIVFAEVKTRTSLEFGFPAESVNFNKKKHILNTAKYFLYINNLFNYQVRFDVIEVYLYNRKAPKINHIKSVFW